MNREGELGPPLDRLRRAETLVYVDDLDTLELDGEDSHHLVNVLRLRDGAEIVAADGAGRYRFTRLGRSGQKSAKGRSGVAVRLEPVSVVAEHQRRAAPVVVGFALQKGDRAELCVQKLTELGVDRIVPLLTEHTVVRLGPGEARARGERLRKISREAGRQSRRLVLPEMSDPQPLREAANLEPTPVHLAEPGGALLSGAVRCVFVGPEGGFSEDELAGAAGLVDLGDTVLRSETAAIAVATLLVALDRGRIAPAGTH